MKKEWTLFELLGRFPDLDPYTGAVLRCARTARCTGSVHLIAWPASEFLLTCLHQWPLGLTSARTSALDASLLRGLVKGAARIEHPPWRAHIVCEKIDYVPGKTTAESVESAMIEAIECVVSRGEWIVEGSPPTELA